ncbi:Abi family protein [Corynebacterium sp. NML 150383]|uniref:Abi family protein n=1 Tax=Corynebacterium sp. NML 150383 TaxID=2029400 RepID=UPI002100896E|nr:Abi family protein [Corynebacterium sp. NML 150383]
MEQQIAILKARNMLVDEELASQWLQFVGYYRLSAYWYPAREIAGDGQSRTDNFLPGTKFSDAVHLYEADRKLRTLVHDGMERIEIAVRALVTDTICLEPLNDPRAYLDADRFRPSFHHVAWLSTIYRRLNREYGRSEPLKHYSEKIREKVSFMGCGGVDGLSRRVTTVQWAQIRGAVQNRRTNGNRNPV